MLPDEAIFNSNMTAKNNKGIISCRDKYNIEPYSTK